MDKKSKLKIQKELFYEVESMDRTKPPIPIEVVDLKNFVRLALALTDGPQILWYFKHENKHIIALFTAYMYWTGDLPMLAYVTINAPPKPFLAYKSDSLKGEEWMFTNEADDTKYKHASLIEVKEIPKAFKDCLEGDYPLPSEPMLAEVENINSIIRILFPLSVREGTIFPLWHFTRKDKHIIGTCIPFEHYYEADALPVFFYVVQKEGPEAPFIKYSATKPFGERIVYTNNTAEAKYFYTKIIDVKDFPIFP
jgi:hypothetical protein